MKTAMIMLIISINILTSCSIRKAVMKRVQTKMPDTNLDNRSIVEDVDYYTTIVEKISPYPYLFTTKAKVDSVASKIKLHQSLRPVAFYEQFLTLQGAYNVAHMSSSFPKKQFDTFLRKGGKIWPIKCNIHHDSILAVTSPLSTLPIKEGDKILSINGMDADSLFKSFYRYHGGLEEWRKREVSQFFAKYLWLNNIKAPFMVKLVTGNEITKLTVEGHKPGTISKNQDNSKKVEELNEFISYKVVQDTIAFIDFKSMSGIDNVKFDEFLLETFKDVKQKKIQTLFIDLRNNSGGNSNYGKKLIDYFNSKPFRMAASKKWLVSQAYKDSFRKMMPWYARALAIKMTGLRAYYKHENDVFYKNQETPLSEAKPNEDRFEGKVYVLIGNKTFSSAMMMANAIEDFDLATLVGEPTGDAPNHLGEIVVAKLPNSRISFQLPSALFVRASGDHENIDPVIPDIFISGIDTMELSDIIKKVRPSH